MSNVGQLTYSNQDGYQKFEGAMTTLKLNIPLEILPNNETGSVKSPTHRVYSLGPSGISAEIGVAWKRDATRGPNAGKPFLSIVLDDPSLDKAIDLVAFPNQDDRLPDQWNLVWRRKNSQLEKENFGAN